MPTRKKTKKAKTTARRRPARRPAPRPQARAATAAPASSGIAPGMQPINTFLAVANVRASMTFLERALGFVAGVVLVDPDGQPRYAEMQRDGAVVMLTRKGDITAPGSGAAKELPRQLQRVIAQNFRVPRVDRRQLGRRLEPGLGTVVLARELLHETLTTAPQPVQR